MFIDENDYDLVFSFNPSTKVIETLREHYLFYFSSINLQMFYGIEKRNSTYYCDDRDCRIRIRTSYIELRRRSCCLSMSCARHYFSSF